MTYLHKHDGTVWKYYRARISDEMPCLKQRSYQWFLFKLVNGEWEYVGFYPTMKAAVSRLEGQRELPEPQHRRRK